MIDPTPLFKKAIQSTWDPTQEFYVGLIFANKDELQVAVKQYHIKRNQTFSVKELDPSCWSVKCKYCSWHLRACFRATHGLCEMLSWIIIVSITGVHWPIRNMLVLSCNMGIWGMIVSTTNVDLGISRIFRIMTSMSSIWIMKVPTI